MLYIEATRRETRRLLLNLSILYKYLHVICIVSLFFNDQITPALHAV